MLAGPAKLQIPPHPRIRALGYVSDEVRAALLAHARVLIVPSRYESLSIVLLEGWNHAVPALVNAHCRVLAGQVTRANGGLHYRSFAEFAEALSYLLDARARATHARAAGARLRGLRVSLANRARARGSAAGGGQDHAHSES